MMLETCREINGVITGVTYENWSPLSLFTERLITRCIAFAVLLLPGFSAAGNDYDGLRKNAVRACAAVDARGHQSGLMLNPDGYRSYYLRSRCYQDAAIKFRDIKLCKKVRQRRALFSSSWGYSKSNCKILVEKGIAKDRETLDRMKTEYAQGHVRLSDFRIERNGNGRDFDIIPEFSGTGAHGYDLRFEIIRKDSGLSPVLLKASGFYLEGDTNNIRMYVPQEDIRKRFPGFTLDESWQVRATLVYSTGTGSYAGKWSDAFIASRFPVSTRTQTLMKESRF
jgi:hypothetical protein